MKWAIGDQADCALHSHGVQNKISTCESGMVLLIVWRFVFISSKCGHTKRDPSVGLDPAEGNYSPF